MQNTQLTLMQFGIPCLNRQQTVLEVSERIFCARLWCSRHRSVLCDPELHSRAKFQLYKMFVKPILTYGCEVWTLDSRCMKNLIRFESSTLSEIYKSKYPRRHPKRLQANIYHVYGKYRDVNILDHVCNQRLNWNYLLRHEERAFKRLHRRETRIKWA